MLNTETLIKRWPDLPDALRAQLLGACATRGKFKGYLLETPPNQAKRRGHWLAWQALISNLAPSRVSVFSLVIDAAKEFNTLDDTLEATGIRGAMRAIEPDYRWNMYAASNDTEKARKFWAMWLDEFGLPAEPEPEEKTPEQKFRAWYANHRRNKPASLRKLECIGGPWSGSELLIDRYGDSKTAIFSASGMTGRYSINGTKLVWECMQ